jgi:hypothetical protein
MRRLRTPFPALLALLAGLLPPGPAGPARAAGPVWFVEGPDLASGRRTFLLSAVRDSYAREVPWFGRGLEGPVTIAWVEDPAEFRRRTGIDPATVGGVARPATNEIFLNARTFDTRPERIRSVLHHELCHLLFAAATAGAQVEPPRWLNEGVAMWRSGEWDLGFEQARRHADVLRDASAAGNLLSLEALDGSFPGGPFFALAYAQSISFVEWMLARGGEESLRAYLSRLDADEDPSPAFAAVYGIPLEEAEEEWRSAVGGGALGRIPSGPALFGAFTTLFALALVVRWSVRRWRTARARGPDDDESGPFPAERP